MSTGVQEPARAGLLWRALRSIWTRAAVTVGLLAIVAAQIDWAAMERHLSTGRPGCFAAAVALLVVALGVGALRWQLLLRNAGIVLGAGQLLRVYAISSFSSTFLPTTVGGDVARALLVARRGPLLARAALTVVVDRAAAFAGLIGLSWLALVLDPEAVPDRAATVLGWTTVACVGGAIFGALVVARGAGIVRRLVPTRLLSTARASHSVLASYLRSPLLMAAVFGSSVVFQALVSFQLVLLALAIDVQLPFATAAVALALVTIVTLIPLSIAGFGVREASYVVLLGAASIGATEATLISVLTIATLFFASLPGAYLLARGGVSSSLETAAP